MKGLHNKSSHFYFFSNKRYDIRRKNEYVSSSNMFSATNSNNAGRQLNMINKRVNNLINESIYYLNKSKSKWVSVGYSLEKNYQPVLKIGGHKNNQTVVLNEEQWLSLLQNQGNMFNFIHSKTFGWNPIMENGYQLHFVFIGLNRIIKISQDGGNEVFLAGETINDLISLQNLVKYRFDILKNQDFSKYYDVLLEGVSLKNGDILKNIYDVISEISNSANICCILELLQLYPDLVIEDVELHACNEFVKSCIEK